MGEGVYRPGSGPWTNWPNTHPMGRIRCSSMKVTLADSLGTCFGVRDAIHEALDERFRGRLTVVGQLVHNPQVVDQLDDHGVRRVDSADADIDTPNVMITAHGAPASMKQKLHDRGFTVYDASCPLVVRVHKAVARLVSKGFHPVVIGQEGHVEVRGIVGDLEHYTVIGDFADLDQLAGHARIGIVCQTTQQVSFVDQLVAALRERFPAMEIEFIDTICKPTKDRQVAVDKLAREADLMIVVGGYNSSNTKKLKKRCEEIGVEVYHVERPADLKPEWFVGKQHVGITAGTSTPEGVIAEMYDAIKSM
jgi:4-hydroxy-3-methylbut-2-en-1-yl diphosphate reductase